MTFAFGVIQVVVMWVFPPAFCVYLTRRLNVSWRYVGLGALTWLTALPFLIVIPTAAAFRYGQEPLVWGVALSLAAGIFEETSRYVYYRFSVLRDPARWNEAVVAGAAHGGTESMLLGVQALMGLIMFTYYPEMIPAEYRDEPPTAWFYALSALSRVIIIITHIGFTMLVWRAVSRRHFSLLLAAVAAHIGIDLLAFAVPVVWPSLQWVGWLGIAAVFAGALWLIRDSRPASLSEATAVATPVD